MNKITEFLIEQYAAAYDDSEDDQEFFDALAVIDEKFPTASDADIEAALREASVFHHRMAMFQQQLADNLASLILDRRNG